VILSFIINNIITVINAIVVVVFVVVFQRILLKVIKASTLRHRTTLSTKWAGNALF